MAVVAAFRDVSDEEVATLKKLILDSLKITFEGTTTTKVNENLRYMGPGHLTCLNRYGEVLVEKSFGVADKDAVPLRSLSKLLVAATIMVLHDRKLVDVTEPVGSLVCPNSSIANDTMTQFLSMSSKGMDNRFNVLRREQLEKRGEKHDFVGYPGFCDEMGWRPSECVEKYVCPLLREEPQAFSLTGHTADDFHNIPDNTCGPKSVKERRNCLNLASQGYCTKKIHAMLELCPFACLKHGCNSSLTMGPSTLGSDPRSAVHYYWDTIKRKKKKQHTYSIVYDNYGYTVVDSVVKLKTGHYIDHWLEQLILIPLEMFGTIKCLSVDATCSAEDQGSDSCSPDYRCLSPPLSPDQDFLDANWKTWPGGGMTPAWSSNNYFASSHDMTKFLAMLIRNGTKLHPNGSETVILTKESVDYIFTPYMIPLRPFGDALGVQEWGLGVGHCVASEDPKAAQYPDLFSPSNAKLHPSQPGISMCLSEDTWSWGSSHGSRFTILRDKNLSCFGLFNQPTFNEFSGRSHLFGVDLSSAMREVFPV